MNLFNFFKKNKKKDSDVMEFDNFDLGISSYRPTYKLSSTNYRKSTIATTIFNRIAIDVSSIDISHIKLNEENQNEDIVNSSIQNCLSVEANIDQSHRDFIHDLVYSMFDEDSGVVAVVPIEISTKPKQVGSFDILSMRVARIVDWYPKHIKVDVYNDMTGSNEQKILPKSYVAIIENPFKDVVSGHNSTLKRLIDKLVILDDIDGTIKSNRLDLLIQSPISIKTEVQRKIANKRVDDLVSQLENSPLGIGYIDASEKVIQLNRPITSQILEQIKDLKQDLYNQLGLTKSIFDGTASENEIRNYHTGTIDVILDRITSEFNRKFLTKTARSQGHKFIYRRDPMKLLPVDQMASTLDTYLRNAIMTPNEARKRLGLPIDTDSKSDKLYNRNIADVNQNQNGLEEGGNEEYEEY